MGMPRSREPGYVPSGTILYMVRLRQLSFILFLGFSCLVLPGFFLALAAFEYAGGHGYFAQMIIFLVVTLVLVAGAIWVVWTDEGRAAVPDRVLLAVDDAGVYLADPPRRIPWPQVGGLVAFRGWREGDDGGDMWSPRLVVVRGGEDYGPSVVAQSLPSPGQWAGLLNLRDEKVRLRKLAAAVHTHAPDLPVWDAGKVKDAGKVG
jgi:hypothetical protein